MQASLRIPQAPDRISQVTDERKAAEKRVAILESQRVSIAAKELLYSATRENEERIQHTFYFYFLNQHFYPATAT
jgi:hypothetical protein